MYRSHAKSGRQNSVAYMIESSCSRRSEERKRKSRKNAWYELAMEAVDVATGEGIGAVRNLKKDKGFYLIP